MEVIDWLISHWPIIFWVWFVGMVGILSIFPPTTEAEKERDDCDCAYWEDCPGHEEEEGQDTTQTS